METIIQQDVKVLDQWKNESEVLSLYAVMQRLSDRRRRQGRRYPLALVLTYILVAKAAGETTLQGIAEWIRLPGQWLQEVLPGVRGSFPCPATSSNVLRAIDPQELNQALMSLLTRARAQTRKAGEQEHVGLDGKTLRGTQHHLPEDQKKMHQVHRYETQTGIVLNEQIVGDKENELSRIQEVLTQEVLKGRIISADAFHPQRAFCLRTILAQGEYLLLAKGNHPPPAGGFAALLHPTSARWSGVADGFSDQRGSWSPRTTQADCLHRAQ